MNARKEGWMLLVASVVLMIASMVFTGLTFRYGLFWLTGLMVVCVVGNGVLFYRIGQELRRPW